MVVTDHQPLKWLMTIKEPQPRVARWIMRLIEYSFTIEYRPGAKNANADGLSRWPMGLEEQEDANQGENDLFAIQFFTNGMDNEQLEGQVLKQIIE